VSADLADELVPIAAELVGCVRDFGPDAVAAVLARVPEGRHDALAVVLAAMVNPDASLTELLAWTALPVHSRSFEPLELRPEKGRKACPDCGSVQRISHLARHRRTHAGKVT